MHLLFRDGVMIRRGKHQLREYILLGIAFRKQKQIREAVRIESRLGKGLIATIENLKGVHHLLINEKTTESVSPWERT